MITKEGMETLKLQVESIREKTAVGGTDPTPEMTTGAIDTVISSYNAPCDGKEIRTLKDALLALREVAPDEEFTAKIAVDTKGFTNVPKYMFYAAMHETMLRLGFHGLD